MATKEDKEISYESFRNSVFSDYANYQKNGFYGLLQIIGETVNISQDVEMELVNKAIKYSKIVIEKMVIEEELSLDRMKSKELIDKLDEYGFFNDVSPERKKFLIRKLKNVIECRNWLIHTSVKEYEGKKQDTDELFQAIAKNVWLFEKNAYADLEQSINQNWNNKNHYIDFNSDDPKKEVKWISSRMDWVALKAIMTKQLLNELWDRLNKNQFSIYT